MNILLRPAAAALALAGLSVCVFGLRWACDPAGLVGLREVMRVVGRNEDLRRLERATLDRSKARRQVAQEVLARRCSLGEALARFVELEREWPDYATPLTEVMRRAWASEEERQYRLLTNVVEELLAERPEEAAAALRRLEEDYRQLGAGRPSPSAAPAGQPVQVEPGTQAAGRRGLKGRAVRSTAFAGDPGPVEPRSRQAPPA